MASGVEGSSSSTRAEVWQAWDHVNDHVICLFSFSALVWWFQGCDRPSHQDELLQLLTLDISNLRTSVRCKDCVFVRLQENSLVKNAIPVGAVSRSQLGARPGSPPFPLTKKLDQWSHMWCGMCLRGQPSPCVTCCLCSSLPSLSLSHSFGEQLRSLPKLFFWAASCCTPSDALVPVPEYIVYCPYFWPPDPWICCFGFYILVRTRIGWKSKTL